MKRFQFCWYGWAQWPLWRRAFYQEFDGSLDKIYRYRIAIGPLDIRRWRSHA
jgi:hypothetical protein